MCFTTVSGRVAVGSFVTLNSQRGVKHERYNSQLVATYRTGVREMGVFQLRVETQSIQMMLWITSKDEHG